MENIAQTPPAVTSAELFKKYFTKDYVSQLDSKLKTFAKEIKKKQRDEYDVVIAVTGYPGSGKTTDVILLSWLINNNYSFEKHVCYIPTAAEIKKKYYEIEQQGVFHIDEATKAMHKYRWWDSAQQVLNTIYDTERQGHYKATILIMPRFQNFTENFRNFRIQYWINIIDRGVAIVYRKDMDKDVKDPWHLDENYKMKQKKWMSSRKRIYERNMSDIIRMESKTQNYWFYFQFPKLPDEIINHFMKLRNEAKINAPPEETNSRGKIKDGGIIDKQRTAIFRGWLYAKELNPSLTITSHARVIGMSEQGLSTIILAMKKKYPESPIPSQ